MPSYKILTQLNSTSFFKKNTNHTPPLYKVRIKIAEQPHAIDLFSRQPTYLHIKKKKKKKKKKKDKSRTRGTILTRRFRCLGEDNPRCAPGIKQVWDPRGKLSARCTRNLLSSLRYILSPRLSSLLPPARRNYDLSVLSARIRLTRRSWTRTWKNVWLAWNSPVRDDDNMLSIVNLFPERDSTFVISARSRGFSLLNGVGTFFLLLNINLVKRGELFSKTLLSKQTTSITILNGFAI